MEEDISISGSVPDGMALRFLYRMHLIRKLGEDTGFKHLYHELYVTAF